MSNTFRMHALEKTKVVHMVCDMRKQFTDMLPALAVLTKPPQWRHQVPLTDFAKGAKSDTCEIDGLASRVDQVRLMVKAVDVTGTTLHEDKDDPLCTRSDHGITRRKGMIGARRRGFLSQHATQCESTESAR